MESSPGSRRCVLKLQRPAGPQPTLKHGAGEGPACRQDGGMSIMTIYEGRKKTYKTTQGEQDKEHKQEHRQATQARELGKPMSISSEEQGELQSLDTEGGMRNDRMEV
ncbi:hypothetical protein CRENBAI_012695 [Crenichthys baileyi]|uniref:Uncharacterized protein n=1 Tax=Crenichthys baileyi TaxID=28760 RepID=A0AAV9RAC8_9TELE